MKGLGSFVVGRVQSKKQNHINNTKFVDTATELGLTFRDGISKAHPNWVPKTICSNLFGNDDRNKLTLKLDVPRVEGEAFRVYTRAKTSASTRYKVTIVCKQRISGTCASVWVYTSPI